MMKHVDPLAAWKIPGGLFIGGLLVAAAAFGKPQFEPVTDAVAPTPLSIGMIIGASASEVLRDKTADPATAVGRKSFAFGHLEFDWDPSVPGGVPGFDSWPI